MSYRVEEELFICDYEFEFGCDGDVDHGERINETLSVNIYLNSIPIGKLFFLNNVPNLDPLINSIMTKQSQSYNYKLYGIYTFMYMYDDSVNKKFREILCILGEGINLEIIINDSNRFTICYALKKLQEYKLNAIKHSPPKINTKNFNKKLGSPNGHL